MALRLRLFYVQSNDYYNWLGPWFDFFVQHGRWHEFAELTDSFANYPPLYMYFVSLSTWLPLPSVYSIKLISITSDYVAAWYIWRLVRRQWPDDWKASLAVTLFLFSPSVVLNSALWGQCDIMYTAGFLASLFYLLERRPVAMLIAFGVACSLKPQAIFWCPLLAGLFFSGRVPWKWIWMRAAVYVVSALAAMAAGQSAAAVLSHWVRIHDTPGLVHGAANWYQWTQNENPRLLGLAGIVLTALGTALLAWCVRLGPRSVTESRWLVSLALISVLFPPFFLPGMHERYFFAADVLALVYVFYIPGGWLPAILIPAASTFSYFGFLFGRMPISLEVLTWTMAVALILVIRNFAVTALFASRAPAAPVLETRKFTLDSAPCQNSGNIPGIPGSG